MANFYAVYETLSRFFGDIPISMLDDTRTAVSRGAALYHWGLDENNDAEDARKISTISNKLASNIYVRNAAGNFTLLIPSDLSCILLRFVQIQILATGLSGLRD